MRLPSQSVSVAIALAAALTAGGVDAQIEPQTATPARTQPPAPAASAPGISPGASKNPVDITAEGLDVFQPQHLSIFKGNVEATQDQARLRTPELRVYSKDKSQTPGAKPSPAASGVAPQMGSIDHMEAAGPVYYITPTENARGDHGEYLADPDTITLTGNVVLVQGKSVGKGDKLVINRKTGESNLISYTPKTVTGRVRVILYPQQQPAATTTVSAATGPKR